jgi:hypothetical protein
MKKSRGEAEKIMRRFWAERSRMVERRFCEIARRILQNNSYATFAELRPPFVVAIGLVENPLGRGIGFADQGRTYAPFRKQIASSVDALGRILHVRAWLREQGLDDQWGVLVCDSGGKYLMLSKADASSGDTSS